jgi:hypothetical protein
LKKTLLALALLTLLAAAIPAQKIEKPKLTAVPPTDVQRVLIDEGIVFHDHRRYDDAIRKYEQVLRENPDCMPALYELSLSLYNKPDKARADEVARKGAQYKSNQLAGFYGIIANNLDDSGKSEEAIALFKTAMKILKEDKSLNSQLGEISYNFGLTYFRLKQYTEARNVLKDGVYASFGHPSANFLLAEIFTGTKYKIPGLMAAARYLGLDQKNPARVKRAAAIILERLKKTEADEKTGNINIFLDMGAPKDEGDFGMYELLTSISGVSTDEDKKANKTENQKFIDSLSSLISMLGGDKKLRSTFVGKTYIPYLDAMRKAGYHETLGYLVLQTAGNSDASKWTAANPKKVLEFYEWSRAYQLPGK